MARMDGDAIRVNGPLALPRGEVELRYARSRGPGGQHAQRNETRVEAVFDVDASATLTQTQKTRIRERVGPVVRAVAQDERSQSRNRELALERLAEQLREALHVRRPRRATKPTRASQERRLDEKRRRGQAKRLRQPPPE
jgi:ribosome-associated protein